MNPSQLFSGRVFVKEEQRTLIGKHSSGSIIYKIIENCKKDLSVSLITHVIDIDSTDSYDSFILESHSGEKIKLKLSLEEDCVDLKRQYEFLKSNNSEFTERLISYGSVKVGKNINYLITSFEAAQSLKEISRNYFFENIKSFLFTLFAFSENKTHRNTKKYISDFIEEKAIFNDSSLIVEQLQENYGIKNGSKIFSEVKKFIEENYDKSILEKKHTCHGLLNSSKILSKKGLFKFIDCENTFKGNSLFDVAFLCVDLCLSEKQIDFVLYHYSKASNLSQEEVRKEFDCCLKVACAIYFLDLLNSYFIESVYFLGENKYKISLLINDFAKSFFFLKKINIIPDYIDSVKNIFTLPIIESQADTSLVPNEVPRDPDNIKMPKAKKPKVEASLIRSEEGVNAIEIHWDLVNNYSNYYCYVIKPNGEVSKNENTKENDFTYDDIDLIGKYGVGVKTIGDKNYSDSEFDIAEVSVFEI